MVTLSWLLVVSAAMAAPQAIFPGVAGAQLGLSALAGATALAPPAPSIGGGGSSGFHVDLDVATGVRSTKFVRASDIVPELCLSTEPCGPNDFSTEILRATVGLGLGSFAAEAFIEQPIGDIPDGEWSYGFGARLDVSPSAMVSFQVRGAYLRQAGTYSGEGGRGSFGVLVRPLALVGFYGEASLDVTTVPEHMNEFGTMFSYSYFLGGGARFYIGI